MEKNNDHDIVVLARKGNEEAFQELYARYSKYAYFIALKTCGNEADAQDVVQNAFLQIHGNIKKLKEPDAFKGWLYQIVVTCCKRLYRKNYRSNRHLENIIAEDYVVESRKEFVPEKEMRFKSDQEVIQYYLNCLSGEQRLVMTLFYFEQMSIKEIAKIMDIPEGTVKSRMVYGRKFLYDRLTNYEKRNEEKLTFQAFDGLLVAWFASAFAQTMAPLPMPTIKFRKFGKTSTIATVTTIGMLALATVTFASGYFQPKVVSPPLQQPMFNSQPQLNPESSKNQSQTDVTFRSVMVDGKEVQNARDAYFELIMWAYDERELGYKEQEELMKYKSLYEEIKRFGGVYYELLSKQWAPAYEVLIKGK